MTAELPLVLKVGEVAELLKCDRKSVYALIASEQLGSVRLGRAIRIPRAAVAEFLGIPDSEGEPRPALRLVDGGGDV